jgi:hypothetical protein
MLSAAPSDRQSDSIGSLDDLAEFLACLPRATSLETDYQRAVIAVAEAAKVFITTLATLREQVMVTTGPGTPIRDGRKACEAETLLHQASQDVLVQAVERLVALEAIGAV